MTAPQAGILLVDDQLENLIALEAVLEPLEQRLVRAHSGREALLQVLRDEFALILMDVQMPDLDGFETAAYIKERRRSRDIPIIFLTAISKEEHHVFRGYTAGAVDYLTKPYDPMVLRSKVSVFLDLHAKTAALAASERQFRTAFAHAPIGMALLDTRGDWLQVNGALCSMLGYRAPELLATPAAEVTHPEDRDAEEAAFALMMAGEIAAHRGEKRYLHRAGHVVNGALSVSLIRDESGAPLHFIAQVEDVTARHAAERERAERLRERAARAEAEAVTTTLSKLQRITDAALAHVDLDDLMRDLVVRIAEVLEVEHAAIRLRDPETDRLLAGAAIGEQELSDGAGALIDDLCARVVSEGTPIADRLPARGTRARDGLRSLLAVPLRSDGRVSGVVHVASRDGARFGRDDESLLRLAADRVAVAIAHARLYERERKIVEMLQRSLLPKRLPQLPNIAMAARYAPAGTAANVGGDWYDAIPMREGLVGLVMGDVVGHGLEAASLMGHLRSALRAYALEEPAPDRVLGRLDRLVAQGDGQMATVIYLVVDPASGVLRFASAGHLPPLLVPPGAPARFLEGGRSLPLGVSIEEGHAQTEIELEAGSTLVLYTDGLVERRRETIDIGLEELRRAAADGPDDPEALCDHILASLEREPVASDDVAVLVLRLVPVSADRLHIDVPADPSELATVRRTLERWLETLGLEEQDGFQVQVACSEACANAVEHAYGIGDGTLELEAVLDDGLLSVSVRDQGRWRKPRTGDRGRGIRLMEAFMDSVDFIPGSEGTTVCMTRRVEVNGAAATGVPQTSSKSRSRKVASTPTASSAARPR